MDEWSDVEDYYRKYNPETDLDGYSEHLYIFQLFDTIGFLLEKSVIDLSFLDDLFKTSIMDVWIKYEPVLTRLESDRVNQNCGAPATLVYSCVHGYLSPMITCCDYLT